eukprot:6214230-Pleurochrysis_carterae.AAC.11
MCALCERLRPSTPVLRVAVHPVVPSSTPRSPPTPSLHPSPPLRLVIPPPFTFPASAFAANKHE